MEISLNLARMVWNLDWELEDKANAKFEEEKVYALWQKSPLMLKLMPRNG